MVLAYATQETAAIQYTRSHEQSRRSIIGERLLERTACIHLRGRPPYAERVALPVREDHVEAGGLPAGTAQADVSAGKNVRHGSIHRIHSGANDSIYTIA